MDSIPAGLSTDVHDRVADSGRLPLLQVFLVHQADTHGVTEDVALVARIKGRFPSDRGNPHTVAVVTDAADGPGNPHLRLRVRQFAKVKGVKRCYRAGTHTKDVPQDTADSGCGPLVRFHGRRVVVAFGLEDNRLTIINVHDPGAFTWSLEHPGVFVGEEPEDRLGLLVRTVFTPHCGEEAGLRVVWQPPQELFTDVVVFRFAQAPVQVRLLGFDFFR